MIDLPICLGILTEYSAWHFYPESVHSLSRCDQKQFTAQEIWKMSPAHSTLQWGHNACQAYFMVLGELKITIKKKSFSVTSVPQKYFQICPYCDINHKVSLSSNNVFGSLCLTVSLHWQGKCDLWREQPNHFKMGGNKLLKRESPLPHKQRKDVPLFLSLGFSRGRRCRDCKFLFSHRGWMESLRVIRWEEMTRKQKSSSKNSLWSNTEVKVFIVSWLFHRGWFWILLWVKSNMELWWQSLIGVWKHSCSCKVHSIKQ